MFVIEVIPLIKGTALETLSYFSSQSYPVGSLVEVPIRQKPKPAIVVSVVDVTTAKSALRQAAYTLQKLPPQSHQSSIPASLIATAEALLDIYPASLGSLLYQLLPPEVREGSYSFPNTSTRVEQEETTPQLLTAPTKERYIAYRSHLRSTLARRGSVLFVAPTSRELETAYQELSTGIEDRVVLFMPGQSTKARAAAYADFEDTSLAKVIFVTPTHAYLDRVDLLSMIVEHEASDFYRGRERPYLDHRTALISHAKNTGRSLLLGDILPRPEVEHYRRLDSYITFGEETKRIAFSSPLTIVEQADKATGDVPFSLFSRTLKDRMRATLEGRGRVFLFGARRGLAPVVACIDCGYIFRCPDSQTPYSLLKTHGPNGMEERWFVSSTSGKRVHAADTCAACGSWRLRERGIGIQSVLADCAQHFPSYRTLLFDHLTASTRKRAREIIDQFYEERSTILIGTPITLPYLTSAGVELSAVVSLDATRSNPTWHADEQTLRLLLNLREISSKEVIVQTRTPKDQLLEYAETGTTEGFYTEELELRQALAYPPFVTFILLTWQGEKSVTEEIETEIKKRISDLNTQFYSNPLSTDAKCIRHALLRIPKEASRQREIVSTIRNFPPYIKVEIDPPRIV